MDTIAAIATARGAAGIGVIRVSGDKALDVAKKCFKPKRNANIEEIPTYSAIYGNVVDENKIIDEAILLIMRKPHSYTGEDVVEFQCHGGFINLRATLEIIYKSGAKPAKRGEFTKRAFLNGRIDLTQAEAVMDIISAKNENARVSALSVLNGNLGKKITNLKERLVAEISLLEAVIDFPDEMEGEFNSEKFKKNVIDIIYKIKNIIDTYREGRILKEGLKTAIIGRPNVGKSSILNALMREDRAIVSDIPGTTRDLIEGEANILGVPVVLVDTAGIRSAKDEIEHIGIDIAKKQADEAELILAVFDSSMNLQSEDREIMSIIKNKNSIIVLNKIDKDQNLFKNDLINEFPNSTIIELSAKSLTGFDNLKKEIANFAEVKGELPENIINNERTRDALIRAKNSLENSLETFNADYSEECIVVDLREALNALGEITGETLDEDVINKIFEDFCIGK